MRFVLRLTVVLACCSIAVLSSDAESLPQAPMGSEKIDAQIVEELQMKVAEMSRSKEEEMAQKNEEISKKDIAIAALTTALAARADRTQVQLTASGESLEVPTAAHVKALEKRLETCETRLREQDAKYDEGLQQVAGKTKMRFEIIEGWMKQIVESMAARLTALEERAAGGSETAAVHPGRVLSEASSAVDRAILNVEAPYGIADVVLGNDGAQDSMVLRKGGTSEGSLFTMQRGKNTTTTPALSMDLDGKVGIGISSPSAQVHIASSRQPHLRIEHVGSELHNAAIIQLKPGPVTATNAFHMTGIGCWQFNGSAYFAVYRASATSNWQEDIARYDDYLGWRFYTAVSATASGTVERVRIASNGNVGIGTTSPTTPLDVIGDASVSGVLSADDVRIANGATMAQLVTQVSRLESLVDSYIMPNIGSHSATLSAHELSLCYEVAGAGRDVMNGIYERNFESSSNPRVSFRFVNETAGGGVYSRTSYLFFEIRTGANWYDWKYSGWVLTNIGTHYYFSGPDTANPRGGCFASSPSLCNYFVRSDYDWSPAPSITAVRCPAPARPPSVECWQPCGSRGGACSWCNGWFPQGGACCKDGVTADGEACNAGSKVPYHWDPDRTAWMPSEQLDKYGRRSTLVTHMCVPMMNQTV